MSLINCKIELSLTWNKNCILSTIADDSTFAITDAKLYVLIVTLSIEDNAKLSKLLSEGFKRSVYWNNYNVTPNRIYNQNHYKRELLEGNCQGVRKLFVLAYGREIKDATENGHRKYFLTRVKIENYNIEIDGRNFYDQQINELIQQYDKVRKISTGQGDYYTTGCLLDCAYFDKNYRLIAVDLSKQKALDADPRTIQQTIFTGQASENVMVYYILEKSKETTFQVSKGTTKVLRII